MSLELIRPEKNSALMRLSFSACSDRDTLSLPICRERLPEAELVIAVLSLAVAPVVADELLPSMVNKFW